MFATIHPHDLRHAFVTLSLDASGPENDETVRPRSAQPGPASDVSAGGIGEASMLKPANPFAIRSVSKIEQEVRS